MNKKTLLKRLTTLLLLGLLAIVIAPSAVAAQSADRTVVLLNADGPVAPAMANYIARGIGEADDMNAEAVVLQLDTPGGDGESMLAIVQTLRSSDVPVIVWVGPAGAGAGSAGLFVTLAGHAAVMAPETAIGASSPVGAQGEDLGETMEAKVEEFYSAEGRALAERRGEDAIELVDDAVKEARAVNANEALAAGLIDFIEPDVPRVLNAVDGMEVVVNGDPRTLNTANVNVIPIDMSLVEQFQMLLVNPALLSLLLSLGGLLIVAEVYTPGGGFAGVAGIFMLVMALYGLGVVPVNWLGFVFIGLAIALFLLEIKLSSFGTLALGGTVSLGAGIYILFNNPGARPFGRISIPWLIAESVFFAAVFMFLSYMALRIQTRRPMTGWEGMIGKQARVTTDLMPEGMVQIQGDYWRAEMVDGEHILKGEDVEIVEVKDMRLKVRRPLQEGSSINIEFQIEMFFVGRVRKPALRMSLCQQ